MTYVQILILYCIYGEYSFPFDMEETEKQRIIEKLLKNGFITEDLSDVVTGYETTEKGNNMIDLIGQCYFDNK